MLVIKVELWPYGDSDERVTLATGAIVNDGTGTATKGNYKAVFAEGDKDPLALYVDSYTKGMVWHHPRMTAPVWSLVMKALEDYDDAVGGMTK
jgi:hypothetical protein